MQKEVKYYQICLETFEYNDENYYPKDAKSPFNNIIYKKIETAQKVVDEYFENIFNKHFSEFSDYDFVDEKLEDLAYCGLLDDLESYIFETILNNYREIGFDVITKKEAKNSF